MRRRTTLSVIVLLSLGVIAYAGFSFFQWNKQRSSRWRNRARARRVCKKYRRRFKRRCRVMRRRKCPKGWAKIKAFKYPTYLACRRALRNERLKKVTNVINMLNPLVNAYKTYMAHVSKHTELRRIPRRLRRLYQPYFRVPLKKLRVGVSRQLNEMAITDCYKIYFQRGLRIRRQLRARIFRDKKAEHFFLHELAHAEQCFKVGGRNNYATMWFRHLGKSVIRNILAKKELNGDNIHKLQPMEKKADRKADRVQKHTHNYRKPRPNDRKPRPNDRKPQPHAPKPQPDADQQKEKR